jgi:hypothetical protein
MIVPPSDLGWFADKLAETIQVISDAWDDSGAVVSADEASPQFLHEALQQLIQVLQTQVPGGGLEEYPDNRVEGVDISELGDYGLQMLLELYQMATDLALDEQLESLEQLSLSLSLWVVGKEGELSTMDLVVNSLARIANHCTDLASLERLFFVMGEILDAIPPLSPEDLLHQSALHPFQLLLLNRAIVATRTLTPRLMEIAYTDVSELLPEEAPRFFSEGMEQIEIQNYPDAVREVIENYYRKWPSSKTLH